MRDPVLAVLRKDPAPLLLAQNSGTDVTVSVRRHLAQAGSEYAKTGQEDEAEDHDRCDPSARSPARFRLYFYRLFLCFVSVITLFSTNVKFWGIIRFEKYIAA